MASGARNVERRRAARVPAPPVRPKGSPRRRQASRRVLAGIGAAVAAILVGVVLAVILSGGSSHSVKNVPAVGSLANALPGATQVNALFSGIPQLGTTLGSPSAPVTMVEYIDLQCPYCQQFETQVFPDIVRQYVRTGELKVVMRPWAFIGPDSFRGQAAVLAAAQQDKAFNYAALLYDNQGPENGGWLNDTMVTSAAASIPGLRVHTLLAERNSASVKAEAQNVTDSVAADGVNGTPTLFVGKTGTHGTEVTLNAPTDEGTLVQALRAALAG
jgi:protein-disulfide isomerase